MATETLFQRKVCGLEGKSYEKEPSSETHKLHSGKLSWRESHWQRQCVDDSQIDIHNSCKLQEGGCIAAGHVCSCCNYGQRTRDCILGLLEVCHNGKQACSGRHSSFWDGGGAASEMVRGKGIKPGHSLKGHRVAHDHDPQCEQVAARLLISCCPADGKDGMNHVNSHIVLQQKALCGI